MDKEEQKERLAFAQFECERKINASRQGDDLLYDNVTNTRMCEMVWDNILCWDPTPADTVSKQPCPGYVAQFNTS
ncbi:calcitonin gene-related peptide type 1 receptor, partial [Biomphalaria pfeifferi]